MLLRPNNIAFTKSTSPPLPGGAFQCLGATFWRGLE